MLSECDRVLSQAIPPLGAHIELGWKDEYFRAQPNLQGWLMLWAASWIPEAHIEVSKVTFSTGPQDPHGFVDQMKERG